MGIVYYIILIDLIIYIIILFHFAMDNDPNSDEWELSKENVQPLKQGRSFAEMSMAIQPSSNARILEKQE